MCENLLRTMAHTVPEKFWPAPGAPLIIAASGGPDSTALSLLMQQLNLSWQRGWRLHLAHLNHLLRPEAGHRDAQFVAELASRHGWGTTLAECNVAALAAQRGLSIEECARDERYAFFGRVLDETGADVVATAHHADDNVETVLHRLLRGTGLRGLAGIPACRPLRGAGSRVVIRPLLAIRRRDLQTYLDARQQPCCHDASNEQHSLTRNRIRHQLLPAIETEYNPAASEAVLRLAQQARWAGEFIDQWVERRFAALCRTTPGDGGPGPINLDAVGLLAEPRIVQTEIVRKAFRSTGAGEKKLTFEHLLAVVELATKNISGKRLELPGGVSVRYDRKNVLFERHTLRRSKRE